MCSAAADVLLARSAASSRGRGMRAGEPVELASAAAAAPAPAQTPAPAPAPLAPPPAPGPRARRRDDDEVPPPEPFGAAPAPLAHAILHHKKHQWQFQIAATPTLWSSGPSCYSRRSVARAAAQLRICTLCERPDSHLVAAAQSTPRPRAGRVPRFPSSTLSAARGASLRARLWLGNNTGPGLGLGSCKVQHPGCVGGFVGLGSVTADTPTILSTYNINCGKSSQKASAESAMAETQPAHRVHSSQELGGSEPGAGVPDP